jgi:hypothetical protein
MHFSVPESQKQRLKATLRSRSQVVQECNQFLHSVYVKIEKDGEGYGDGATLFLAHHAIENLDAISLLIEKGSTLPCFPLLRGVFEAMIGSLYVCQHDAAGKPIDKENRGLAYLYHHFKHEQTYLKTLDRKTPQGRSARGKMKNDIAGPRAFDNLPSLTPLHDEIQTQIDDPIFASVPQTIKEARFWHGLQVEELAKAVKVHGLYTKFYEVWSRHVHCLSGHSFIASVDKVKRLPLTRTPVDVEKVVASACNMALIMACSLRDAHKMSFDDARNRYIALEKKVHALCEFECEVSGHSSSSK